MWSFSEPSYLLHVPWSACSNLAGVEEIAVPETREVAVPGQGGG